jgi:ubiquinone biosynthesis protein
MAIEELGPAYIKLGQAFSTRSDLIPPDFVEELSKLQDHIPSCPFHEIQKIIEKELNSTTGESFAFFEKIAMASASIGQVHKAILKNGQSVAVKVQRPGIQKTIEIDLEIMLHLATLIEEHIEELALHSPIKIIEEFARRIEKEIDYTIEADNMDRFAHQFSNEPTIYTPILFRELTTKRVLTMEFVKGIKVSEVERLEAAGLDRKIINDRGADLFLQQIFEHGFFHADPHPGNIFILPNHVICLLDFGMVGSIDKKTRENFVDLIDSVVRRDESGATRVLLKLTLWEEEPDIRMLERELAEFMAHHLYKPLKDVGIAKLLQDLLEISFRHRLRIPPDIFLMMKAFSTVEGIARMLDPNFDMVAKTAPFVRKIMIERLSPTRLVKRLFSAASELLNFIHQFPEDTLEITRLIRQRKLVVNMKHQGFEKMLETWDRIGNRISFSLIVAALIIGSALIVISRTPPLFHGISLIGLILFFAAAIMGIWLLVAILKKGGL